jgi:hypothetical protein
LPRAARTISFQVDGATLSALRSALSRLLDTRSSWVSDRCVSIRLSDSYLKNGVQVFRDTPGMTEDRAVSIWRQESRPSRPTPLKVGCLKRGCEVLRVLDRQGLTPRMLRMRQAHHVVADQVTFIGRELVVSHGW